MPSRRRQPQATSKPQDLNVKHITLVIDAGGQVTWDGRQVDAVALSGAGERWIEQTVQPDNRSAYALSFDLSSGGPAGWVPNVKAEVEVTYEDGSTEIIEIDLV